MILFSKFNAEHIFRSGQSSFWIQRLLCPTRYKSRNVCKCVTTNTPHPPRDPPENYNPTAFTHRSFDAPKYIQPLVFRPLCNDDILGPNAAKNKVYKNPEYFAYHRFSQVDLFMNAMRIRMERKLQQMCPSEEDVECNEGNRYNENHDKERKRKSDAKDGCQMSYQKPARGNRKCD